MLCACGSYYVLGLRFAFSVLSGCKIDNAISTQLLSTNRAINDLIMRPVCPACWHDHVYSYGISRCMISQRKCNDIVWPNLAHVSVLLDEPPTATSAVPIFHVTLGYAGRIYSVDFFKRVAMQLCRIGSLFGCATFRAFMLLNAGFPFRRVLYYLPIAPRMPCLRDSRRPSSEHESTVLAFLNVVIVAILSAGCLEAILVGEPLSVVDGKIRGSIFHFCLVAERTSIGDMHTAYAVHLALSFLLDPIVVTREVFPLRVKR